ncbi:MAG: hypothetical protein QOJ09_1032 [Actinomycetota bacterium]|jgi:hypothetical protein|nr:hypothetical protein [Actinomycetota bacterium]
MLDVIFGVVLTAVGVALVAMALPLLYGIVRLVGPWEAYPDCWRLFRMVARPE